MVNGQRINIHKDETLLGRSGVCDVQFHDPKVSRQHALLRRYNEQYYLYDMQSSGGTFVNGQRIESAVLHDQDQVRMGDSVVVFRQG
jgi:pSer/pThr/pTyr-binding forkhead associated (FHA) protein